MEKSQCLVVFLCMFLFTVVASATQFKVCGSNGWTVPQPNTISYNQWAQRNRFKIGDSLLFTYAQGEDSVLLVNQDAYNNCNTSSPIKKFDDGNTVFTFDRSGLFFFISGVQSNCLKKESLVVAVMGDRTKRSADQLPASPPSGSNASAPATSPSGSNASAPATSPSSPPAGTGEAGPSAAPTGADNNSNPNPLVPSSPDGEEGKPGTPSSSPSGDENNNNNNSKNGASLKVVGLIGSIGPLLALAMFAF
ncbi:hypothetical protein LUZ60_017405 [Juncus effusus]|nr:hypothetical protein LUZ60_017405 [Juncus effusus]